MNLADEDSEEEGEPAGELVDVTGVEVGVRDELKDDAEEVERQISSEKSRNPSPGTGADNDVDPRCYGDASKNSFC